MYRDTKPGPVSSTGILIGLALGTALGVALEDVAIGAGVGLIFAIAFGWRTRSSRG